MRPTHYRSYKLEFLIILTCFVTTVNTYETRRVLVEEPALLGLCFEGENIGPNPGIRGGGSRPGPLGLLGVTGLDGDGRGSLEDRGGWTCEGVGGVFKGEPLRFPTDGILQGEPGTLRGAEGRSDVSGN